MSALTAERNTPIMESQRNMRLSVPVKGSTKIYKGGLIVINAGYAAPGSTATGLVPAGIALQTADNSSGADGAITCEVMMAVGKFVNSGGDAVVAADVGASVYITDDQTVNHTSTGKSAAGKCIELDTDGVWVYIGLIGG